MWACGSLFLSFLLNGLYFTAFFLQLFHNVEFLLPLGPFVKIGHQQYVTAFLWTTTFNLLKMEMIHASFLG